LQSERSLILDQIYNTGDVKQGLFEGDKCVLDLFQANGAVLFLNGAKQTVGDVPSEQSLNNLLLWLQAKNVDQVFSTHNLVKVFDEAIDYSDKASGLLVIPFGTVDMNYLVLFRPELIKTIEWGGNPHEAINFDPNGITYHPRNSFKIWLETVNQTSLPWHHQELQIAESLKGFLIEYKAKDNKQKDLL
jgi:two-component system, chemotaxis family, sensor kinase Cph1